MLYHLTVKQFAKVLGNLDKILDKAAKNAESRKFDVSVLLNARLAPDQFNFIRQVQIATDTAKFGAARLAGKEAPTHDDKEATIAELKVRIASVIQYLGTFSSQDFQDVSTRRVTTPRWEGKYMLGSDYAAEHVLPNFYFHVSTAYAILRHNGVDIGKADYLGELSFKR